MSVIPGKATGDPASPSVERDALAAENLTLRMGATSQGEVADDLRRRLADAEARFAAREDELKVSGDALRLSLAEARLLAESLTIANRALSGRNSRLEDSLTERTAELATANNARRRDQEHLQLIFESATEYAIFTLDLEGRVTTWNPGAQRILGYEESEILGRPGAVIFTPEERAEGQPETEMSQAVEDGRASAERWHIRADGSRFWAGGMMMPLRDREGRLQGFLKILCDHTERRRDDERRLLVTDELAHRVKNTLAAVQSVAVQTLREADISPVLQATLVERLKALGRAHDMLVRTGWKGALLSEVLERTLSPYAGNGGAVRYSTEGPSVRLSSDTTVILNLALHELATNAAKYGALSAPSGHVEVVWEVEQRPEEKTPAVVISWREREGPPVRPSVRRGFGTRMLERALPYQSGGEAKLSFEPEGVECRMRLPIAQSAPEKDGAPS
ncbi:HWE histidine kinase domain-containing protein [Roseomonas xinghualingensis]|uniref:HWE histidine kinase domain-containing protein n=1 Tax=Roseomonas xinghualingensis TaxID=2986475 RepID=UPI0021F1B1F5|nr:HWE histidine kinase domain-containing protein [Roseomonas sp. SXEYE001]MCV4207938.1 PAS domain S-box protein [Roseomonas sp. SXEYE001]